MSSNSEACSFDLNAFMMNFSGIEDLAFEAADNFIQSAPELMDKIRSSVGAKDAKQLEISAHSLKGAVSNFYAVHCQSLSKQLEEIGRSGDLGLAESTFRKLEHEMQRFIADISGIRKMYNRQVS